MLTVLAGSILFCVSSYVGICIKKHYKGKCDLLKDVKEFCDFAENKISLLKQPVVSLLYDFASVKNKETERLFSDYAKYKDSGGQAPTSKYLTKEENQIIFDLIDKMGESDVQNEIVKLKSFRVDIASMYEKSLVLYKQKGVLYYKLSVLAGIALMLLVC